MIARLAWLPFWLFAGFTAAASSPPVASSGTATVELREIDSTYAAESVVEAVRQATVAAQVPGRILDVRVDAGDRVKQGDLLMRIDARDAAEGVAAARAQYENAKANYERLQSLRKQHFISQAALDKAEADYRSARAAAGQAGTALSFTRIGSPITGVIAQRHAEAGEMASPGRPLVTVYDPRGLRVLASIPQYKLAEVRQHLRAKVEFPDTGRWVEGVRVEILPAADARTHTVRARVDLPADLAGVIPGMFARAHFVTGRARKLVMPASAVLRRGEVTAAYVANAQGGWQLRQIRVGEAAGEALVEVLAGLAPGEKVALDPVKAGIQMKQAAP